MLLHTTTTPTPTTTTTTALIYYSCFNLFYFVETCSFRGGGSSVIYSWYFIMLFFVGFEIFLRIRLMHFLIVAFIFYFSAYILVLF